jgi:hypothetical protein
VRATAQAAIVAVAALVPVMLVAPRSPGSVPSAPPSAQSQMEIAKSRFGEALAAVAEAHRLMPEAVTRTVQYEELKDKRSPACEEDLAAAKVASSRARKQLDNARGRAAQAFQYAKRALQSLGGGGRQGAAKLAADLPWAETAGDIDASLKQLKSLYDRVNSSLTTERRAKFWAETIAYCKTLPKAWSAVDPEELVPASVTIPCLGHTVDMRLMPAK